MEKAHFTTSFTRDPPDLVVNRCPIDCVNCGKVFVNPQTGHRIVCKCQLCGHNKGKGGLAQVVGPEASTLLNQPTTEVVHDGR
jgi:hypothetical protein